jgi:adenine-specific DNA methylase
MKFDNIQTIRYMGTKSKLLDFIIPEILQITPENGTVCDLLAGSNAISYALKRYRRVITNDIQEYSYAISIALIVNQFCTISKNSAINNLSNNIKANLKQKYYHFFEDTYSYTYFSKKTMSGY